MKNNIDSFFAIAVVSLVAACVGFSFYFNDVYLEIAEVSEHTVTFHNNEVHSLQYSNEKNEGYRDYYSSATGIALQYPAHWILEELDPETPLIFDGLVEKREILTIKKDHTPGASRVGIWEEQCGDDGVRLTEENEMTSILSCDENVLFFGSVMNDHLTAQKDVKTVEKIAESFTVNHDSRSEAYGIYIPLSLLPMCNATEDVILDVVGDETVFRSPAESLHSCADKSVWKVRESGPDATTMYFDVTGALLGVCQPLFAPDDCSTFSDLDCENVNYCFL